MRLLKVKRELKKEAKKVFDLKVQLMNSEENRASQVRTLTDRIVHLERDLASLQEQKAVTTFSFILTVALLPIHLIHTMTLHRSDTTYAGSRTLNALDDRDVRIKVREQNKTINN
jgi:hypothetical protein